MINKIRNKIIYWQNILENQQKLYEFSKGHQVQLYNWSFPCIYDHWLIDFIEKRGLLKGKPKMKVGLYSIFAPFWLSRFDNCDIRIFVERENLHKPSMKKWLHRFIDDKRICLSLGFDDLDNPEYMRFPFWIMWSVFSPTATYKEIKQQIQRIDSPENHNYTNREFCTFICGHDDIGRKQIFDKLCNIDNIHCPGRLFHNNDDLKNKYNDNKLEYLKHYPWLDTLKAFAIYLVILGHIINNCIINGYESRLCGILYFTHVPLFLVISGMLVKDKPINTNFLLNLLLRFVVPYTTWSVILTTFYLGRKHLFYDSLTSNIIAYYNNWCHSFLWFIKVYLIVFVLWQILKKFTIQKRFIIGTFILVIFNLITQENKILAELASLSLYAYTLFGAGALLKNYLYKLTTIHMFILLIFFATCLPFATTSNNYFELPFM